MPGYVSIFTWLLSTAICVFCSYYLLLLSFDWGIERSWLWVYGVITTVLLFAVVSEPLYMVAAVVTTNVVFGLMSENLHLLHARKHESEIIFATPFEVKRLRQERLHARRAHGSSSRLPAVLVKQKQERRRVDAQMRKVLLQLGVYCGMYVCLCEVFMVQQAQTDYAFLGNIFDVVAIGEDENPVNHLRHLGKWGTSNKHDNELADDAMGKNLVYYDAGLAATEESVFNDAKNPALLWEWMEMSLDSMAASKWLPHSQQQATGQGQIYFVGAMHGTFVPQHVAV